MGKNSLLWEQSFYAKQVNQCPHHGDVAQKNTFLQNISPVAASGYCVYFLLELKRVDVRLKKREMNFYKETLKKNSNNLVQNQEQVTVSSIASVMKTSTSSYCSGESQISNKSSCSSSIEYIYNEIIELLIAIWEDLCNIRHPDYSVKQKRNNDT